MKRKLFAFLLAALVIAGAVSGCSGASFNVSKVSSASGSKSSAADSSPAAESAKKITVLCGYASEDPHGKFIYQYAESFAAEKNVEVEIQAISTNDIYTKLAAMATTPDEIPALFFTSADQVATLYDLGLTEDLNTYLPGDIKSTFANGVYEACQLDGKMAFYPIAIQPQAIIYRKDRFEEAKLEIPKTWEDFTKCAKTLTKDTDGDGENDEWGFSMIGSNNSSGQSRFMAYLWSNGFKLVYQEDGKGEWKTDISDSPEFLKAFSTWTGMNEDGVVPTGITEVDYATSANYFAMGYTNMFLTGPNALGVAYANNPDLEGKLASFTMPGDHPGTMLNVEGYAMSSNASEGEKAIAAEFLTYFTSHDTEMQFWQASGKIPSTLEGQKVSYLNGEDYAGFLKQIENGCLPTITFPGVSGMKSALGDAYSAVFSKEKTNEQAVQDLVKDITELLEDYN